MALFDQQLESHPVWASLVALRKPLEDAREQLADPEQIALHSRVEAILSLLDSRLRALDAQLVYFSPLDSINGNLQQVAASLEQFNANPGHRPYLDQAESQASGILAYLAQQPALAPTDVENLREIGARYRQSMSGHIGRITVEYNGLKEKVDELAAQVTAQESQVSTEVTRLTTVASDAATAFTEAQTEREQAFEKQSGNFATSFADTVETAASEARTHAEEALEQLSKKADNAWEEIAALKQRAEQASSYLGINALAGGYHQTAESEDKRAFWTRIGAILCFVGAIAASGFAVIYHIVNAFSAQGALTKALFAVPFLVLAGYLARESSRHADRAHFNRQRQRQLESLPAYVDALEPDKRAELYAELAPGFFAPVSAISGADDRDSDPLLTFLITELKKRAENAGT
jgi:hypothetical protein